MLRAKREITIPSSTNGLWFPGSNFFGGGAVGLPPPVLVSPRSEEIKKSRDELINQLRDTPESNFELSLTDLIVNDDGGGGGKEVERKDEEGTRLWTSRSEKVRRSRGAGNYMARKSTSTGTSTRNDGGGVLLNMFIPTSLGRSFTYPSPPSLSSSSSTKRILRKTSSSSEATRSTMDMREKEGSFNGCWPTFWNMRRSKKITRK